MPLIGRDKVDEAILDTVNIANDNLRAVYFSGLSSVISGTPVDEGRARNNWFMSINEPSNRTTTSKGSSNSTRQLAGMQKRVIGKKVYFTNNMPYIGVLEYGGYPSPVKNGTLTSRGFEIRSINGFSKQAPKGWVRASLIRMQNKIRRL